MFFAGDLSASDTSLVELVERQRRPLPQELMPLPPSLERDSPLDWTHLVDVANTFDGEENGAHSAYRRTEIHNVFIPILLH